MGGNEELKAAKLAEYKASVETILDEVKAAGGEVSWVEKVEIVRFERREGADNRGDRDNREERPRK